VRTIAGDGGTAAAKVYFDSEFVRWGEVIRNAKISMQ
jgi:hypothetical protein